jgi:CRISPR-associated protein Cmr6
MRNALSGHDTGHAGLLLECRLPLCLENAADLEDQTRRQEYQKVLIEKACKWEGEDLYRLAFQQYRARLEQLRARTSEVRTLDRVIVGLGADNPLETSITLNRLYGVPLIPGSALKGLARSYLRNQVRTHLDQAEGPSWEECDRVLFGDTSECGKVVFFDAWWVPDGEPPLSKDVITVHHPGYYNPPGGKRLPPTDFDDPNPVSFVSARGSFLVAVKGPDEGWTGFALKLLLQALEDYGVGAKTSSGYGRLIAVEDQAQPDGSGPANLEESFLECFLTELDSIKNPELPPKIDGLVSKLGENVQDPARRAKAARVLRDRIRAAGIDLKKKDGTLKTWAEKLQNFLGQ